jgi:galactokinase
VLHLQTNGISISGCDIHISSTLPKASGLSSSAALEVLCFYMFSKIESGLEPNRIQMALDCQKIENEFIGVKCGIMDQYAVANGKKSAAILLNCNSLENEIVPLKLNDYSILLVNSNKSRALATSAYNLRIKECSESLDIIRSHRDISNLVDALDEDLNLIDSPILRKRTRHAFTENEHVKEAVKSLKLSDLNSFGKLMHASHLSLQNDFEVSCPELNHIVEALTTEPTCLGARMTGAGFGGCCVALVETESMDEVSQKLASTYTETFGFAPSFYQCIPSDGVHEIAL